MPAENNQSERAKPDKRGQFGRFGNRREGRLQRIALQVENRVGAVYFRDEVGFVHSASVGVFKTPVRGHNIVKVSVVQEILVEICEVDKY